MKKELYFAPATKILSVNMAGSILAGSSYDSSINGLKDGGIDIDESDWF